VVAIATLLRAMRRRREAIYVAAAATDVQDEWTALRNELEAQGSMSGRKRWSIRRSIRKC